MAVLSWSERSQRLWVSSLTIGLDYQPHLLDFMHADLFFTIRNMAPEAFDHYPDLSAYIDRVYALSAIKKYVATRPATEI